MLISALIKGWWRSIADAVERDAVALVTSPDAIEEFLEVTTRTEKRPLLEPAEAEEVADLLRRAELYAAQTTRRICRDPDDDYLLALAEASNADVLVTRDEDLLTLRRHGRTEIIHVADFLQRIAAPPV